MGDLDCELEGDLDGEPYLFPITNNKCALLFSTLDTPTYGRMLDTEHGVLVSVSFPL